jgi:voltage-gated potassium channel
MNDTVTHKAPLQPHPPRDFGKPGGGLRQRAYTIIFEADTRAGRTFDIILVALIVLSVITVVADSAPPLRSGRAATLAVLEWVFTVLFTLEYLARLACVRRPWRYATSFFGVIDLMSILPAYFALLLPEVGALLDIRILRLLRMFRIFKLTLYVAEYQRLGQALAASARKIMIFLSVVLMIVLIMGTVMYVVEGPDNGFTSIPHSMYWATVTMTTVGYGDMVPHTPLGRLIASFMMLMGWGILAVPTGIVTAEMTSQRMHQTPTTNTCPSCLTEGHDLDARYCKYCGAAMDHD